MSSVTNKMASNVNLGVFGQAKELKRRLLFMLGALVVYRFGTYIPLPNIDPQALSQLVQQNSGGVLGMFNMFSGGALGRMSIFALNIMPYITASIVMQLMTVATPSLSQLKKDGEAGRRKLTQYTRYGTVLLAGLQGWGIATGLMQMSAGGSAVVVDPGIIFVLTTVVTLVGGTMFLMWLGEQITARGIGNGISLIIFSGIIAEFPSQIGQTFEMGRTGELQTWVILMFLLLAIGVIALIVFMERAHRRIVVQYPKRQRGNKMFGGEASHIPLKLNTAGVIPPIFASSILLFPATLAGFNSGAEVDPILETIVRYLSHGTPLYMALYVAIIVFFCFFYTSIVFNSEETADNLKKNGGFIPGRRPGKNTAEYFDYVLTRLTVIGAIYLSAVCILPEILVSKYSIPLYLGGTSLLIVVNVIMDTINQIQTHLFAHQYEGLIKKTQIKGRRR